MSHRWKDLIVAPDRTHHLLNDVPAYTTRFVEVLKFHAPGLAPVRDRSGAYHIQSDGQTVYDARYVRTFGFYEGRAAVQAHEGWFHILDDGRPLYPERYDWCGNFQGARCTVRNRENRYFHLQLDGTAAYAERYRYAGDYRDGIAVVQHDDGLHTHIDHTGQLVHGQWFLDLDVFHKEFARARTTEGWLHIDMQGWPAYDRRFRAIEPFYNGQARVEEENGALLVINEVGETLVRLRASLDRSSSVAP
jgi:hypothetical protein